MEDSGPVVADEKLMEGSKDVAIGGSELVLKHVNSLKRDLFREKCRNISMSCLRMCHGATLSRYSPRRWW